MLLFLIDLLVVLCLAAQVAIAAYFLYLVYWLFELPRDETPAPVLPDELLLAVRAAARRDTGARPAR
jgi:hypothetical protein